MIPTSTPLARRLLSALAVVGLCAAAEAQATLIRSNGVLGTTIDYQLSGDPGELFIFAPSMSGGPIPLSILNPADPRVLSVGLELTGLWQISVLDGAGNASLGFNLNADPSLHGVSIYAQFVTVPGSPFLIDDISNPTSLKFGLPQDSTNTVEDQPRSLTGHSATELADGRVLLAGGVTQVGTSTFTTGALTLFDPQTQTFADSVSTLSVARTAHSATLLADGRVLVCGGADNAGVIRNTVDLYDPVTDTSVAVAPMSVARTQHTATRLPDGRVFVAGGTSDFDFSDPLAAVAAIRSSTEIYDPVANTWSPGPSLPKPRVVHSASLTGDGRVLITGGIEVTTILFVPVPDFSADCRLYNPVTGAIQNAANFSGARGFHGQLTLANGDVLVAGGGDGDIIPSPTITPVATCRLYDVSANTWSNVGSLNTARGFPQLLDASGTVVAIGGLETVDLTTLGGSAALTVETTSQTATSWTNAGSMILERPLVLSVRVDGGQRILSTGAGDNGSGGTVPDRTAEIYIP